MGLERAQRGQLLADAVSRRTQKLSALSSLGQGKGVRSLIGIVRRKRKIWSFVQYKTLVFKRIEVEKEVSSKLTPETIVPTILESELERQ